jgi:hypothetical protein
MSASFSNGPVVRPTGSATIATARGDADVERLASKRRRIGRFADRGGTSLARGLSGTTEACRPVVSRINVVSFGLLPPLVSPACNARASRRGTGPSRPVHEYNQNTSDDIMTTDFHSPPAKNDSQQY